MIPVNINNQKFKYLGNKKNIFYESKLLSEITEEAAYEIISPYLKNPIIKKFIDKNYNFTQILTSSDFFIRKLIHTSSNEYQNRDQNRYINILPNENTLVKIFEINDQLLNLHESHNLFVSQNKQINSTKYINANYININGKKFIATQAPNENTYNNFINMLLQEDSQCIVTFCNNNDIIANKIYPYWTNKNKNINYKIIFEHKFESDGIVINILKIFLPYSNNTKKIVHVYYNQWPDNSVPNNMNTIYKIHCLIKSYKNPIIHCSAGVGRTGTFIAISICINKIDTILDGQTTYSLEKIRNIVNIPKIVKQLKIQRNINTVQTNTQYHFIYDFLNWYIKNKYSYIDFY